MALLMCEQERTRVNSSELELTRVVVVVAAAAAAAVAVVVAAAVVVHSLKVD